MKLLNHTLKYLSMALLLVISIWAALFYFNMIDEVRDSLDDGLENNKMLVIKKVAKDEGTILRSGFDEHNYAIREISELAGLKFKDRYQDTLMYTLNDEDFEPFRMLTTVFNNNNKYYELKVVVSTVEEEDLVKALLYSLVWLYLAILVSILVINNFLLRKIWTPFYLLLEQLKKFRLDKDQKIKTSHTTVREFTELNDAVSGLVAQAVRTYDSQKQFIENASHELQTPLAISLNRLELLAETEGLSDEHLESIGKVIGTLQRLTRLNKSLLLLSKIENKQYGESTVVTINEVVKTFAEEFSALAALKNIKIVVTEPGVFKVTMNKDLAAVLVTNLLKNAIRHNVQNGSLEIVLTDHSLSISNTGLLLPLDDQKLFKRFQKESKEKNSIGLGLAIVKAISDLYGFNLHYNYVHQHYFVLEV